MKDKPIDEMQEFKLEKGDKLTFVDKTSAIVVDIKDDNYYLRPCISTQDLGNGCGCTKVFKLKDIPRLMRYGGIKRPFYEG